MNVLGRKRKYFTPEAARDAQRALNKEWQRRRSARRQRLKLSYCRRRVPEKPEILMVTVAPIHQCFLTVTLPVPGSYGFGAVVRRTL